MKRCPYCARKVERLRRRDAVLELVEVRRESISDARTEAFVHGIVPFTAEPYVELEWTRPPSRILVHHTAVCDKAAACQ